MPFPTGTADLIYCRFLLTYLAHPQSQVAKWSTQLKPGDVLLLDEVEWIRTSDPVFGTYLKIVATMLDHQGDELYVGSLLDAMPDPVGLQRRSNQIARLAPASRQAANMFLMNLRVWRDEPFVRATYGEGTLNSLESDLATLAKPGSSGRIVWDSGNWPTSALGSSREFTLQIGQRPPLYHNAGEFRKLSTASN